MRLYYYEELAEDVETFLDSLVDYDYYLYQYTQMIAAGGFRTMELAQSERGTIDNDYNLTWETMKGNNNRYFAWDEQNPWVDKTILTCIKNKPDYFNHIKQSTLNYQFKKMFPQPIIFHNDKSLGFSTFRHYVMKTKSIVEMWSDQQVANWFGEVVLANAQNYIMSELLVP